MAAAAADDKLIEDGGLDFSQRLYAELPLRHFGEFHELEKLTKVVQVQKKNVFAKVFDKIWTREKEEIVAVLTNLNRRMDKKVIAEWTARNREHEVRSVSFLQKWVDMLCENFNEAIEYELLLNPDVEIESFKNSIERRKLTATSCFESIWKPGTSHMQEERKSKLGKHLKAKEEEMLEKQKHNLERKSVDKGKTLLGEVGTVLLERSRQVKSYVDKHHGRASNAILKGMVEEMLEYLSNGKGSSLRETHEEIYGKLVETLEDEVKFLSEGPAEKMTAEEMVSYAETLDEKLRSCCSEGRRNDAQEIQEQVPQRRIILQEILNEMKEEQSFESDDGTHGEANDSYGDGGIHVDDEEVMHLVHDNRTSGAAKRRISRHRQVSNRSAKKADSYVPATDSCTTAPEVPPCKEQMTRCDVARVVGRKSIANIRRRSSRLNKAAVSNSMSAQTRPPRTNIPHTKSNDLDRWIRSSARLMMREGTNGNNDCFEGYSQRPKLKRSKNVASKTTNESMHSRNNDGPGVSSELSSVPIKSKARKLRPWRFCRNDDVCPKDIVILKGDDPKYLCKICKRKFKMRQYLKYHGEFCGTAKAKSHICDECGKGFQQQKTLDTHIHLHTGEKPFQCPKCSKRFALKWALAGHIRCHANDNSYTCKPCNLTFVSTHSLHDHNLTHDGKLPFACSHCGKRFDRKHRLRNHVIIHGDERPFQCSDCGISFAKMDHLLRHIEHTHSYQKNMAQKLAYDVSVAYLLKETKNESCRKIPANRINDAVVNHVIKKANLLPADVSAGPARQACNNNA